MINEATREQIIFVAEQMRERDYLEINALYDSGSRAELAQMIADRYDRNSDVLCWTSNGEPVCIGGALQTRPNAVSLLFFATDEFPRIAVSVTRFIKKLFREYEKSGVHRIEAISLEGYQHAHRWLSILGLRRETGPLINFGKGGETFIQFVRVSDVREISG